MIAVKQFRSSRPGDIDEKESIGLPKREQVMIVEPIHPIRLTERGAVGIVDGSVGREHLQAEVGANDVGGQGLSIGSKANPAIDGSIVG